MSRRFPIQRPYWDRGPQRSIPWESIAPHEVQAMRNHGGQTLERLAERHGLGPNEALCIMRDQEYNGPRFSLPRDRDAYTQWDADRYAELQALVGE